MGTEIALSCESNNVKTLTCRAPHIVVKDKYTIFLDITIRVYFCSLCRLYIFIKLHTNVHGCNETD